MFIAIRFSDAEASPCHRAALARRLWRKHDWAFFSPAIWQEIIAECGPLAQTPGLGDAVKGILGPIAKGIDAVAGTDLEQCQGCERRRQALNVLGSQLKSFTASPKAD